MTQRTITYDDATHAMVPKEPTHAMLHTHEAYQTVLFCRDIWRAMIAAAPKPEAVGAAPIDDDLLTAIQRYADARATMTESRCENHAYERRRMASEECAQAYADLGALLERHGQPAASAEPLVRYCPGCGSVGPVEDKYQDCCPDGIEARMIPQSLANKCHDTFQVAIGNMVADQDTTRCEDCPPVGYPTDETRCASCDRRTTPAASAGPSETRIATAIPGVRGPRPYTVPAASAEPVDVEELAFDCGVLDTTDYGAMADAMMNEAVPAQPVVNQSLTTADPLRSALTELVAIEDIKHRMAVIAATPGYLGSNDLLIEYDHLSTSCSDRRQPAWNASRAALAQQPSGQDQRDKALEEAARKCEDIYSWRGAYSAGPLQTSALNACAAAIRTMKSTSARAAKGE